MYDARSRLADQVMAEVRTFFTDRVLDSVIPRSVRVSEAPGYGQSVLDYDGSSRGAVAYRKAARELAFRGAAQVDLTTESSAPAPTKAAPGAETERADLAPVGAVSSPAVAASPSSFFAGSVDI
jgi:chromosome partitioning protein